MLAKDQHQTLQSAPLRALMVDLDGTILGRGPISSPVADAIRLVSQHLPVSIATGAEAPYVLRYAKELGLSAPQICDGGATAFDPADGRRIWDSALSPEQARTVVSTLEQANLRFVARNRDFSATKRNEISCWDLTQITATDVTESVAEQLIAKFGDYPDLIVTRVFQYHSRSWAVDFTPSGVDKGMAARKLAQLMGIDTSQMAAIGDGYNDLPMLQTCGLSVAMGNAPPDVKEAADHVAPSVEADGLAFAIEEYVMPRLGS